MPSLPRNQICRHGYQQWFVPNLLAYWCTTSPLALPKPWLFLQQECCGTSGPMDWVNYTSAFRAATPEVVFPWPPLCCRRTGNFIPINEDGCRVGHMDYLFTKVCLFALCFLPFPLLLPVCPSVLRPLLSSLFFLSFLPGPPSSLSGSTECIDSVIQTGCLGLVGWE